SIDNLELGSFNFSSNAGIISWVDMPVTASASQGTKESYSAQIDGNPLLTVYAESNGTGGIQNSGVGIGTTTPSEMLTVQGNGLFTGSLTAATTTLSNLSVTGLSTLSSLSVSATTTLSGALVDSTGSTGLSG